MVSSRLYQLSTYLTLVFFYTTNGKALISQKIENIINEKKV